MKDGAQIVCMSALLTTTMPYMGKIIDTLKAESLRDGLIVLVGGAPLNAAYAKDYGADAYCHDATEAIEVARTLLAKQRA